MDDIRLKKKKKRKKQTEKELETLIHAVRISNQDIEMEFGIEKCAMLIMKSGKRHLTDRMELPNQEKIKMLGKKEIYKYLGIWEAYTIKQLKMKEKNLGRTKNLLETKLYCRNFIKGINTRAVHLGTILEVNQRRT